MEKIYSNKEEKGLYINNIKRIDLVDTTEYAKKANKEKIHLESVCSTYIRLGSGIQLIQSRFKVIRFTNSKRGQVGKLVKSKEVMAYLVDTPVVLNNNGFSFKNNIEYA